MVDKMTFSGIASGGCLYLAVLRVEVWSRTVSAVVEKKGEMESLASLAAILPLTHIKENLATGKGNLKKNNGKAAAPFPVHLHLHSTNPVGNHIKGLKETHENINIIDTIGLFFLF